MSIQIAFDRVEFLKPYRFFLLVKTPSQSKRTEISPFTQTPQFSTSLSYPSASDFTISACIVLDYSGRKDQTGQTLVFGRCSLPLSEYRESLEQDGVFRARKEFVQEGEKGKVVVGYFEVIVRRERTQVKGDYIDSVEEFRMEREEENQQELVGIRVRLDIHAGVDFPAGSGYYVQVGWSDKYHSPFPKYVQSSKMVQGEMNPLWRQQLVFPLESKLQNGFLNILLRDKDNNLLEQASFEINKIKVFLHYHIEMKIKEEIQAVRPRVFLSFVLQAIPQKSITEEICELCVTNLELSPQPQANKKFILVFANQQVEKVNFLMLDMSGKGECPEALLLQKWRKQQTQFFISPMLISPIEPNNPNESGIIFHLPFLKSKLLKHNTFFLYELPRAHKFSPSALQMIASSADCTPVLKSVFYEQQKSVILLNPTPKYEKTASRWILELASLRPPASDKSLQSQAEPLKIDVPEFQKWKAISNEVYLKQKLVHNMEKEIQERTDNIAKKGDAIESLRRADVQLTKRKKFLSNKFIKEQAINIPEPVLDQKVNLKQLYMSLNTAASQLQSLIQSNAESAIKLQWLSVEKPKLNIQKLQDEKAKNTKLISQMQQRIHKIPFYNEIIRRQKESILKLQKLFQQSQIDKQMNQVLNKQLLKMKQKTSNKVKPQKDSIEQYKLMKILNHLEQEKGETKGGLGKSRVAELKRQIQINEDQLKRKSEYYARKLLRNQY